MKTVKELLHDADPLRHESDPTEDQRTRMLHAILTTANATSRASAWLRRPVLGLAAAAAIVLAILVVGARTWPQGGATVYAAVRFEVRLAEERPAAGLRAARVGGSDRTIYLHEEVVATNADIERSSVMPGKDASQFGIGVRFTAEGARKMREATANHVGRPVAILIDGDVVMAPTLRDPIGAEAMISGDYSRAEAERIVNGIMVR